MKCFTVAAHAAQQWTAWKDLSRDPGMPAAGLAAGASGAPVLPAFPPAVPAVPPGIEARFLALVQNLKTSPGYNVAIGQALGIEGTPQPKPDPTTVQPHISTTITVNAVNVKWGWGGNSAFLDLCEIQVDRGDGKGFIALAFDTTLGYLDKHPFPAVPVVWTYRAIYRVADRQVGLWSLPTSIMVPA